jgi:hypothetical protein
MNKKSEWSKYIDDKALLRVNGKIKFKMLGYDGIVSRDSDTHCLFVTIFLKETTKLSEEILNELKEIVYHKRIKFVQENFWEVGTIEFNSASLEDYIPAYEQLGLNKNKTYKDLKFIKNETKKIICCLIERGIR